MSLFDDAQRTATKEAGQIAGLEANNSGGYYVKNRLNANFQNKILLIFSLSGVNL